MTRRKAPRGQRRHPATAPRRACATICRGRGGAADRGQFPVRTGFRGWSPGCGWAKSNRHRHPETETGPLIPDITLTPGTATALFVIACLAGYRYRHVWKAEGPRWQLWLFGLVAAAALMTLGFVPLVPER